MIPEIHIEDYNYGLEDARIAKYPLPERDASKLLHYKNGNVSEYIFRQLPDLLPEGALMVFNDTKVVPARLHFERETGAHIEISGRIQYSFCCDGHYVLEMRHRQRQKVEK